MANKMNKFQLLNKLTEDLRSGGCKTEVILEEPKSNPLFVIFKDSKKIYITTCEVWTKPSKHKDIVFSGISSKIQKLIELEMTYDIIIDFKPLRPKFIFVKVDSTNYRYNRNNQLIFHFKRPEYGGFYNTEHLSELISEIQKVVT